MDISYEISDEFLPEDQKAKLRQLFGVVTNDDLCRILGQISLASLDEYRDMLLGRELPSRADEIRQHRLLKLIKHYFRDRLPTESEISAMFQLTPTRARSLLRGVVARFRYDLEICIANTLRHCLMTAKKERATASTSDYRVSVQSDFVLDELNTIVGKIAPQLQPLRKVANMARYYTISEDTYEELLKYVGKPSGE